MIRSYQKIDRRKSQAIKVGNVKIGGGAPISVQTMTNTLTTNIKATISQINRVVNVGADLVRVSVPDEESTNALKIICKESPVPIIADIHFHYKRAIESAINGAALGGGLEIALGCDLIVASDTARIGLVEVSVGLMPLAGGIQRLVDRVGLARAKEICMFGRRYDAKTLEKWGVINLVVPEDQLHDSARSFAKQLSNGPTVALKEIKKIANISLQKGIIQADKEMKTSVKRVLKSSDAKSGISYLAGKNVNNIFKGK